MTNDARSCSPFRWSVRHVVWWLCFGVCARALAAPDAPDAPNAPAPSAALPAGAIMQDFGLRALDTATGQLKSIVWLSDYVGKSADPKPRKQLLLLNFFAVWCKPCIAELPVLARLQSSYGPRGLQILSINFRAEGESVERAIAGTRKLWAAEPPNFPVLFDRYTNRNQLLYMGGRASLPCNLLFDRDGRLLERFQGGDAEQLQKLEQRVAALLDSDRRAATELQP